MDSERNDVIIIGAGVAGLTAARILKAAGRSIKVIESSDAVGGRIRTDEVQGFLLDRGFQVLLTAYPETKQLLDYKKLDLQYFDPGALILNENGSHLIGDPIRKPATLVSTLFSPAGSLADKLRLLFLNLGLKTKSIDEIFRRPEITTLQYLKDKGFSDQMIGQFFKPFMTGIFLENRLSTSSRMFEFVFKMFGEGYAAVPAKGMGMITQQLAGVLNPNDLVLNQKVIEIDGDIVKTDSGAVYSGQNVLIATNALNIPTPFQPVNTSYHSAITMYFTAPKPPFKHRLIALNASAGNVLVNNIAVMDRISRNYTPEGKSLIALTIIDPTQSENDAILTEAVKQEMLKWFPDAGSWEHLKTYHIKYALPNDDKVINDAEPAALKLKDNCFICGDHLLNGSINAAMKTGRLAAKAILNS